MSRNVDVVLAGFAAWNRQDVGAWLAVLHPDVELCTSAVFPGMEPVYRGHTQVADFWHAMHEPWETLRLDVGHIEEQGVWVVYPFRFRAKGGSSGVEVDLEWANAVRLTDGLQIEIIARRTLDEAREMVAARGSTAAAKTDR